MQYNSSCNKQRGGFWAAPNNALKHRKVSFEETKGTLDRGSRGFEGPVEAPFLSCLWSSVWDHQILRQRIATIADDDSILNIAMCCIKVGFHGGHSIDEAIVSRGRPAGVKV